MEDRQIARVIVASYLVRFPVGGYQSWILQWMLGLKELGHDVYFVEKAGWPDACYDPVTRRMGDDPGNGVSLVRELFDRFGLEARWCFVDIHGRYHGVSKSDLDEVFRTADIFIDHMRRSEWFEEAANCPVKVRVDGEPAFCQMGMEQREASGEVLPDYDFYYSVGLNLGRPGCTAPTAGRSWRPIFDPVVPRLFDNLPPPDEAPWTTVMSWQAHRPLVYQGVSYGQKDVSFERFIDLPEQAPEPIHLAIAGGNVPRQRLESAGWVLEDAHAVTQTFDGWRDYIARSRGEFSVAKHVFVATRSGFFSDRSAVYLASGRPVILQETGFSEHIPCGVGLFAVENPEEAADAMREIAGDYGRHSRAAREIANSLLNARSVLGSLMRDVGG